MHESKLGSIAVTALALAAALALGACGKKADDTITPGSSSSTPMTSPSSGNTGSTGSSGATPAPDTSAAPSAVMPPASAASN